MRTKPDWTPEAIELRKKLDEAHEGWWVFLSDEIENKYKGLSPETVYRIVSDGNYQEFKVETKDKYIVIRIWKNYVSMFMGDTEDEARSDIEVVGGLNLDRDITFLELEYYLEWDTPDEYYEFE